MKYSILKIRLLIKTLCQSCFYFPSANLLTLSEKREKQVEKGTFSGSQITKAVTSSLEFAIEVLKFKIRTAYD